MVLVTGSRAKACYHIHIYSNKGAFSIINTLYINEYFNLLKIQLFYCIAYDYIKQDQKACNGLKMLNSLNC